MGTACPGTVGCIVVTDSDGESRKTEPSVSGGLGTMGYTPVEVEAKFIDMMPSRGVGTWDELYKYLWWLFRTTTGNFLGPNQFATIADLVSYLATNIPISGGTFDEDVLFVCYEAVDNDDPFPQYRLCRNSLVASARGRRNWLGRGTTPGLPMSGIASGFNGGSYYGAPWINNTARLFVGYETGVYPGTNNDGAIWWHRGRRTLWNWPHTGTSVRITDLGQRAAAWNTITHIWATPAPVGDYTLGAPFLWAEAGHQGVLSIEQATGAEARETMMGSVCAIVFPLTSGNYTSFLVLPAGFDTWVTEYFDPALYELCAKISYRHESFARYRVVPPKQIDTTEKIMFTHFNPVTGESYFFTPGMLQSGMQIDNDRIPTRVYVAKRNKTTGTRSRWTELGVVRRRIPNAALRFDPAFK